MNSRITRKTLLSWSSGKDSAWALHVLQQQSEIEVVGLFCTVNEQFDRVAMHGVRRDLLELQARNLDIPLEIIDLPYPCSNREYEKRMAVFIEKIRARNIEHCAFGDLHLEDVRRYREGKLEGTGIKPLFPLWGMPANTLSREMVDKGLRAIITCIDPKLMPESFIGREYNNAFLDELPDGIDACGENGEFHSFTFAGPMFRQPIEVTAGNIVHRDGFIYADLALRK